MGVVDATELEVGAWPCRECGGVTEPGYGYCGKCWNKRRWRRRKARQDGLRR